MRAIFLKEFKSYFKSPLGYAYIAFMLVIFGFYFFVYCLYQQTPNYAYVLSGVTSLIVFAMPILTMRLMSEEMKNKTDQLLLTSPVKTYQIVLGKYLAAVALFAISLLLTVPQPLTIVGLGGTLPVEQVVGAYIGFFLMGCVLIGMGIFISSLTDNQLVACISTIAVFLLIFLTDGIGSILPTDRAFAMGCCIVVLAVVIFLIYRAIRDIYLSGIIGILGLTAIIVLYFVKPTVYDGLVANVLDWLSILTRYYDFYTGIFDFSHIVYYLTLTAFFVFLTVQMVEKRRWS